MIINIYMRPRLEYEDSGKIEGKNTVFEALSAERQINRVYLDKDSKDQALARLCYCKGKRYRCFIFGQKQT